MTAAIKECNYDKWAEAKKLYDSVSGSSQGRSLGEPDAPSYPIPCDPEVRKLRTTNIRVLPSTEPVKLYRVGTLRKPAERADIGARTAGDTCDSDFINGVAINDGTGTVSSVITRDWVGGSTQCSDHNAGYFTGLYIGVNVSGNFNTLGQTETFKPANVVTNRFEDSSNKVGFGFDAGYLSAPWNNNFRVGLFGSVDVPNQDTNHTFPPGPFFLGQTINTITTVGGQVGFVPVPNLLVSGQVGAAFLNVTQKLNFLGPVTSVDQTVTGANLGVGVAFQPPDWQFAGNPLSLVVQYNRIFLPVATFNNPGSPGFAYDNRNNINKYMVGFRMNFGGGQQRQPSPFTSLRYVLP